MLVIVAHYLSFVEEYMRHNCIHSGWYKILAFAYLKLFTHMIKNEKATNMITNSVGAIELWVFLNSIRDNKGVSPAERLAAVEYIMDKTVH